MISHRNNWNLKEIIWMYTFIFTILFTVFYHLYDDKKRHHSSRSAAKLAIIDALWMVRSRLKLNLYHVMHLIAKNSFSFHVPKMYKRVYRVSMDFLFAWTVSLLFLYFSLSQVKVVSKIKFVSIKSIEMTNNSSNISGMKYIFSHIKLTSNSHQALAIR